MTIVPLQLKIKNFFHELHTLTNNTRLKIFFENAEQYGTRLLN